MKKYLKKLSSNSKALQFELGFFSFEMVEVI